MLFKKTVAENQTKHIYKMQLYWLLKELVGYIKL
jgi:hypothetical protein